MKNLLSMVAVLFSTILLIGCGGGNEGSSNSTAVTTPTVTTTPIETTPSYDLVINNGRGTSNNQNTETPSD